MFLKYASFEEWSKAVVTPWHIQQDKHVRRTCTGPHQSTQVDSSQAQNLIAMSAGQDVCGYIEYHTPDILYIYLCKFFYESMNCCYLFVLFSLHILQATYKKASFRTSNGRTKVCLGFSRVGHADITCHCVGYASI